MSHIFSYLDTIRRMIRTDARGATAVEYAMIVGLVAAVAVGTITTLGTRVETMFRTISNGLQ